MNPILLGGLLIGGLCSGWIVVTGATGFYKDATMSALFVPIVSLMEILVLIWALRKTAARGRTYSGQIVAGTLMALIGASIIFCTSMVFTSVFYPNYFSEVNEAARQVMQKNGKTEEEIAAAINAAAVWQTPVRSALAGVIGTVMTGILASAVIAVWIRARVTERATARL